MARILVVDDEESIRELLKEVLTTHGHQVETGVDGKNALDLVRNRKPYQVIIMDRNMPHLTGVQAVQLIRADPKNQSIKILMCTSASIVKEVEEAFQAGADDYLLKPLNLRSVLDKVAALIA